jgi:hypothetical protein
MSLRVIEFFGFSPTDKSRAATSARAGKNCPFLSGPCTKRLHDGEVSGACYVKQSTLPPVIICPNRMYAEKYRVLLDTARACFGEKARLIRTQADSRRDGNDVIVFGRGWGKELRLPGRGKGNRGGYFVDWVLAALDKQGELREFVAVEVQTMDTTGSYGSEVKAYSSGRDFNETSDAGINWENVSKRILPQLIYKGHVLRNEKLCSKGLFFICPKPVYDRIMTRLGGNLTEYFLQPGALSFRSYDLAATPRRGRPRALEFHGQHTTTIDQVALAFTAPKNLPEAGVYEKVIRSQLTQDQQKSGQRLIPC